MRLINVNRRSGAQSSRQLGTKSWRGPARACIAMERVLANDLCKISSFSDFFSMTRRRNEAAGGRWQNGVADVKGRINRLNHCLHDKISRNEQSRRRSVPRRPFRGGAIGFIALLGSSALNHLAK
jgi:hypothetical protein